MKSDEERQERGDILETRQFGLVLISTYEFSSTYRLFSFLPLDE